MSETCQCCDMSADDRSSARFQTMCDPEDAASWRRRQGNADALPVMLGEKLVSGADHRRGRRRPASQPSRSRSAIGDRDAGRRQRRAKICAASSCRPASTRRRSVTPTRRPGHSASHPYEHWAGRSASPRPPPRSMTGHNGPVPLVPLALTLVQPAVQSSCVRTRRLTLG